MTESLGAILPFGAVWAEAVKPYLLGRHCGLSLSGSLTAIAARKYLLISAQALYVLVAFALGYPALQRAFAELTGAAELAFSVLAVAGVLFALAEGMALLLGGGRAARVLLETFARVRLERVRRAVMKFRGELEKTDEHSVRFFRAARRKLWLPRVLMLFGWLLEATETWAILWVMGARLDFGSAVAIEATVVLVRHVLFVLPAGLGAQELGYGAFLACLGVGPTEGAAFVLVKRARELGWAGLGYLLFVADSARVEPGDSRETARTATVSLE